MKIGIPKEIHPGERRVAATPDTAKRLKSFGFDVIVESGAGAAAEFVNLAYTDVGCEIAADARSLWAAADVVLKVRPPTADEVNLLREGGTLISFIYPAQNKELLAQLAARKATVIAMDAVPRISRAQKLDALSSMANIAGYRAIVEAANNFGRFFTGQMTAAGKVPPAKVLVIGAGVAGLSAIGAARGLGAVVRAFDTRPAVREQVSSMGADFLEVQLEEDGSGEGGYAREMSPAFIAAVGAFLKRIGTGSVPCSWMAPCTVRFKDRFKALPCSVWNPGVSTNTNCVWPSVCMPVIGPMTGRSIVSGESHQTSCRNNA